MTEKHKQKHKQKILEREKREEKMPTSMTVDRELAAKAAALATSFSGAVGGARLSASAADLGEISLLRDDDCLLRQTFLEILRHHSPKVCAKLDAIYAFSDAWCASSGDDAEAAASLAGASGDGGASADADFAVLEKAVASLNPDEMIL